jgi:site-specific recombinase XerD
MRRKQTPGFEHYLRWKREKPLRPLHLDRGLLAPHWDNIAFAMFERDYSWYCVRQTILTSRAFATYAESVGVSDVAALSDDLIDQHVQVRPRRYGKRSLERLMFVLRERGVVPRATVEAPTLPPLLDEYLRFLEAHRALSERGRYLHRIHVHALLESLGEAGSPSGVGDLQIAAIHRSITARAPSLDRDGRKRMCTAVRSFLRFLYLRGHVDRDLSSAVPVIPDFRLGRLPRSIAWEDLQKILAVIDRSTDTGCRDYAIMMILATYGIRAGQLVALRLDDIDWRRGTIHVPAAKAGRDMVLPLLPQVGEAIVQYVRRSRPDWPFRQLFLCLRPPMRPMTSCLMGVIKPYAIAAGVKKPFGPHAWRHACATRLLVRGQSLKAIRDLLGHRHLDTTFIYTKVDVETLRQAALEWPEVAQ